MPSVVVAKSAGFCFGVKRAVSMCYEEAEKGGSVFTLGPIIHNEFVVGDLESRGVRAVDDSLFCESIGETVPTGSTVIIRSHGVSRDVFDRLRQSGCRVVDATCPFVSKIHQTVSDAGRKGMSVAVIGDPEHPEVRGIMGWVTGPAAVVSGKESAYALNLPKEMNICVVSQTTFNFHKFQELVEIIESLGYHVVVTNTICNATRERQEEAEKLAEKSDVMIVIGGKASSNTRKLYEICRSRCPETYFVQSPKDLESVQIKTDSCVGITAGASTPNTIIQEVSLDVRRTEF